MNNEQMLAVLDALELARAKIHSPVVIRPEGLEGFCHPHLVGFHRIVCDVDGYVGNLADGVTAVTPAQLAAGHEIDVVVKGQWYEIKKDRTNAVCIYYRGTTA